MWYVTIAIEILTIIKEKKSIIERERERKIERARVRERQIYRAKVRVWLEEWGDVISRVLPSSGGKNYFSYPEEFIRRKWNHCTNRFLIFSVYWIYIYTYIYLLIIIFLSFFFKKYELDSIFEILIYRIDLLRKKYLFPPRVASNRECRESKREWERESVCVWERERKKEREKQNETKKKVPKWRSFWKSNTSCIYAHHTLLC